MSHKLFAGVKVGDRVLIVTQLDRHRSGTMEPRLEWKTVTKVGRQYAETHEDPAKADKWNAYRFEIATGFVRDRSAGQYEVRAWHSEEEWRTHEAAKAAWRRLNDALRFKSLAPGVSEADILSAAELLKLDMSK